MRSRRHRISWDKRGSLGQEAPLVSARSVVVQHCPPAPSTWLGQQPPSGGRDILLYKVGFLITFGIFK